MILDDIKTFIADNGIAAADEIKYDYDGSTGGNLILLRLESTEPNDLARRSKVGITIKNDDLETARNLCFILHDLLFPEDCFQKAIKINGKTMHTRLAGGPAYGAKDSSNRHNYVLSVTFTYNR